MESVASSAPVLCKRHCSDIDFADDRPYFYGLGLGEEKPHPDLPGLVGSTANEFYARNFFLRWRDALLAVEED